MIKKILQFTEDILWNIRCKNNFWIHGPYGLASIIERMPFGINTKYLRKYGATIGTNCVIERGINLHRPMTDPPFKHLELGDNVYLGHKIIIDLSGRVILDSGVKIGANCQIWTHTGYHLRNDKFETIYKEEIIDTHLYKNVIVYSNVVIKHGIQVEEGVHIGAGSVVIRNVPSDCFIAGNPAVIKDKSTNLNQG